MSAWRALPGLLLLSSLQVVSAWLQNVPPNLVFHYSQYLHSLSSLPQVVSGVSTVGQMVKFLVAP